MTFARRVFLIAGIYGLIMLLPQYFLELKTALDYPPPKYEDAKSTKHDE